MGLSFQTDPAAVLKIGDRFQIQKISGISSIDFLIGVEMKIKWMLRYNARTGARSGGTFYRKSEVLSEKIRRFINQQSTP